MLVSISVAYSAPLINDPSASTITCPFPHNIRYTYGLQPSRYSQAQYAAAVSQFYVSWYNAFVTGTGASTRVWWPDAGSGGGSNYETVSEGIGYGMLIAVQMADKTLFDGLDGYRKAHLDGNGLMNWTCAGPTGATCSGNNATDADQDMCMSLYMAANQWNNATYTTEAASMAASLIAKDFSGNVVTGGDNNTGVVYPDYCSPGWYRCFETKTGNTAWTNVVTWVYNTLCPALESQWTHGYVPNEINNDGTFHSPIALGTEGANNHGYDASRWGWRMGTDYLWNGSNQGPISMFARTMQAGVTANGYLNYIQEYFNATDGNTAVKAGTDGATSPCSHLQIGPALVGCMAGLPNNPVNQAFVDDTYDELARRLMANTGCVTLEYFQDTLGLMCLMVGTGNFPNMACGGCTANTPPATPTPMPCFMLDDLEDDNLINSTNGFWFTFSYASLNNTPVNPTPTRAIVSGPSYILQSPGAAGTNWDASVTGFWMDNGLSTPATYGGFAIATALNAPYNNLLNLTVGGAGPCSLVDINFYIKSTAPMTIRLNFYNPALDPANGGNANQFGYTFPVTTTWQAVTVTYNEIMCQDWNSAGFCYGLASNGSVSLTRDQALTNVTSVQWDTAGNPATLGYSVDQVCMHFAKISNGYYTPVIINTATPSVVPGTPTGTPTSSATRTPTGTPSSTATNTVVNTPTLTPTGTLTKTATSSPSSTATFTPTTTATNSPTRTPTFTVTASPTNTVGNTATVTATYTTTNSPTNTTTNSPTKTVTSTVTSTSTSTLASTATNTTTSTATGTTSNTATRTATPSPTNSPTATPTNSLTNTATNTATSTATRTVTSTTTGTTTSTITETATNTATKTATSTTTNTATATISDTPTLSPTGTVLTSTPSSTPTMTGTSTATFTATKTGTNTVTNTTTVTATNTPTNTTTMTATKTPTSTTTSTTTNTAINTATSTPTNTLANSATNTATATATNTLANSATNTPTLTTSNTETKTTTFTPTNTLANSATSTATATATNTLANSATNTPTLTTSNTETKTTTSTPTNTLANTATETLTNSPTFTATVTLTNTPTITPTPTPTQVTVQASQGSSPPVDSTQPAGASNVAVQQVQLTNPGANAVTLSSLTLTESGASPTGITSVSLVDNGTVISTASFTGTTATFNLSSLTSNNVIPASNGAVTYEVVATFSTSAPTGTYTFSVTGGAGNNGQAVGFGGLPVPGAVVTISSATSTPSSTPNSTASLTPTSTLQPSSIPVVYPNPSTGGPVTVSATLSQASDTLSVQIFTVAFRDVQDNTVSTSSPGVTASVSGSTTAKTWHIPLALNDKSGAPLASGLYYVVISNHNGYHSVVKLLLLR